MVESGYDILGTISGRSPKKESGYDILSTTGAPQLGGGKFSAFSREMELDLIGDLQRRPPSSRQEFIKRYPNRSPEELGKTYNYWKRLKLKPQKELEAHAKTEVAQTMPIPQTVARSIMDIGRVGAGAGVLPIRIESAAVNELARQAGLSGRPSAGGHGMEQAYKQALAQSMMAEDIAGGGGALPPPERYYAPGRGNPSIKFLMQALGPFPKEEYANPLESTIQPSIELFTHPGKLLEEGRFSEAAAMTALLALGAREVAGRGIGALRGRLRPRVPEAPGVPARAAVPRQPTVEALIGIPKEPAAGQVPKAPTPGKAPAPVSEFADLTNLKLREEIRKFNATPMRGRQAQEAQLRTLRGKPAVVGTEREPFTFEEAWRAKTEAEMPELIERTRAKAQPSTAIPPRMAEDAWKLTLDAYVAKYGRKGQDPGIQRAFFGLNHRKIVEQAAAEGKIGEGIKDYPDLQAKYGKPAEIAPTIPAEAARVAEKPPVAEVPQVVAAKPPAAPLPAIAKPSAGDAARARIVTRRSEAAPDVGGKAGQRGAAYNPIDDLADYAIIGAEHIAKGAIKFKDWSVQMTREFADLTAEHLRRIWLAAQQIRSKESKTVPISGVSKARIAAQRAELGLEPIEVQPFRAKDKSYTDGKKAVDRGRDVDKMVRSIADNPRAASGLEVGMMAYRLDQIGNALKTAAPEQRIKLLDMQDTLHTAARRSGREWASTGQALQITIGDNLDLGNVYQAARDNKGRALIDTEITDIAAKSIKYEAANVGFENSKAADIAAASKKPIVKQGYGSQNKLVSTARYEELKALFIQKASTLHAGIDPTMIPELAEMVAYHAEALGRASYQTIHAAIKKDVPEATSKQIAEAYQMATRAKRQPAQIGRMETRLAKVRELIKTKTPEMKPPPVQWTKETIRLREALERARHELIQATKPPYSIRDALHTVVTIPRLPVGWLAAWDNSFMGRQGLKMLGYSPRTWWKAFRDSHRAMLSEGKALLMDDETRSHPKYAVAQQSGLDHTGLDVTTAIGKVEESSIYMRGVERIPGLGRLIRAFDRAFTTAGNVMRHKAFYDMAEVKGWTEANPDSIAYANFLNLLTARGNLGRLKSVQGAMTNVFISPKNFFADLQLPTTLLPWEGTKLSRMESAKMYVRCAVAYTSFATVVNATGMGHVGVDPRDRKTFGVLRIGNTRFNLLGGAKSAYGLALGVGQAMYDYSRFAKTKPTPFTPTPVDVVNRYLGYKITPGIQAAKQLWTKKNWIGEPTTEGATALTLVIPWNAQEVMDAWKSEGPAMGLGVAATSFYGIGSNTYEDKKQKSRGMPTLPRLSGGMPGMPGLPR